MISVTTTDITTTITTISTWDKYKLADLDSDTTDLDSPNPKEIAIDENCLLNWIKVVETQSRKKKKKEERKVKAKAYERMPKPLQPGAGEKTQGKD